MNITDALRRSLRKYPGGADAVAERLKKSPSTFDKELRCSPGFKLGADDAIEAATMCYDLNLELSREYPNAIATRFGCMLVPLPPTLDVQCPVAMKALADTSREAAELLAEACDALADGRVSNNELRRFDAALGELIAQGQALRSVMASINAEGKPTETTA